MPPEALHGHCLCGGVAFVAEGPFDAPSACHCSQCRKWSGHVWASTGVPHDRFRLVRDGSLRWYRASPAAQRGFCGDCGASLFWQPEGEARIAFSMGSLDLPTHLQLNDHIYTEDAGDYYTHKDPGSPAQLAASCLCGACRFTLPGPAGDVTGCHCTQCRRLSGHYAASFDTDEAGLHRITRGPVREFQTGGGGARGFCADCGSGLWFRAADGSFSVEAGLIDGQSGGRLALHIYVADKGDYYALTEGLPHHAAG